MFQNTCKLTAKKLDFNSEKSPYFDVDEFQQIRRAFDGVSHLQFAKFASKFDLEINSGKNF